MYFVLLTACVITCTVLIAVPLHTLSVQSALHMLDHQFDLCPVPDTVCMSCGMQCALISDVAKYCSPLSHAGCNLCCMV